MIEICLSVLGTTLFLPTEGLDLEFLFPRNPSVNRVESEEELVNSDAVLSFGGLVKRHGYDAEEHKLTTDDGYHLVFHRISGSPLANESLDKPVVILQHGVLGSSDTWVLNNPKSDLGFVLSDAGFDVWATNRRGNTYCRSHETLSTKDRDFWQFSFHEMALHDLPCQIDYILNLTGKSDVNFIGHSMGGTMGYVLLSTKPQYNAKIRLLITLASPAYWRHKKSQTMATMISIAPVVQKALEFFDIYDVFPQNSPLAKTLRHFCRDGSRTRDMCHKIIFQFVKINPEHMNLTLIPHILSHFPAGEAVKTLVHYLQNMDSGVFGAFNYGNYKNIHRYKQLKPLSYDTSKISSPVALFYGTEDPLVQPVDAKETSARLSNVVAMEEIRDYTHVDFLFGLTVKTDVYERIIQMLRQPKNATNETRGD